MNILKKLVLKDLKLNKKRTIGTIVGIILSCALIMVVGGMFYTLCNSLLQNAINQNGYYHVMLSDVTEEEVKEFKNNRLFKNVISNKLVGYTYYDKKDGYLGEVYSMDKNTFDDLKYNIISGEFPKNDNELLITRSYQYHIKADVGDYLDIEIGDIESSEGYFGKIINSKTKKMKVVGIVDRYGALITTDMKSDKYVAYLTLKNPSNYKSDLVMFFGARNFDELEMSSDFKNMRLNQDVLLWETFNFSSDAKLFLYGVLALVIGIIMVTSIFSIRNSFAISITEKLKTYGMLSSVGATRKQILKMVLFEGFVVGLFGIIFGIILGLFVTIGLCALINFIAINADLFGDGFMLYYGFSYLPIVLSVVSSTVVIFLSVIMSAIRASHTSPIKNIRNADNIKAKKLKVPKFISKIFGIGGTLSYKNLKRSKKKYRVTVVSLTVSILVFITAASFVEYGIRTIKQEFGDLNYNVEAYGIGIVKYEDGEIAEKSIERINKLEEIDGASTLYETEKNGYWFIKDSSHFVYKVEYIDYDRMCAHIYLYNDEAFKNFVKEIGGDYDYLKNKFILLNRGEYQEGSNKRYTKVTDYQKGDKIELVNKDVGIITYNIGAVVEKLPIGVTTVNAGQNLVIVGNYKYFDDNGYDIEHVGTFFNSSDPYKLEKDIREVDSEIYVENLDEVYSKFQTIILIVSIVVYGFIIVVTLIGVTSVFNTINSNMELRSRDFATLKSIGMTKKEFNNMINLEAIFYSLKSLIYGSILGIIGSYIAYMVFLDHYNYSYVFPLKPIIISIVFIVLIVLILMRYSIKKINKQNIIETIRNSNI